MFVQPVWGKLDLTFNSLLELENFIPFLMNVKASLPSLVINITIRPQQGQQAEQHQLSLFGAIAGGQ